MVVARRAIYTGRRSNVGLDPNSANLRRQVFSNLDGNSGISVCSRRNVTNFQDTRRAITGPVLTTTLGGKGRVFRQFDGDLRAHCCMAAAILPVNGINDDFSRFHACTKVGDVHTQVVIVPLNGA